MKPIPHEKRAAIAADVLDGGLSRSAIARKYAVGNSTVTEIAKEVGARIQPKRALRELHIGETLGRVTVVGPFEHTEHGKRAVWCQCSCARKTRLRVELTRLLAATDPQRSCGCVAAEILRSVRPSPEFLAGFGRRMAQNPKRIAAARSPERAELNRRNFTTHGLSHHPIYKTWAAMMNRCYRPGTNSYEIYGGRGIEVCAEWHDVRAFIGWIEANLGSKPASSRYLSIDRIDNDGDYEPGNVRRNWATPKDQAANKRPRSQSATRNGEGR